MPHVVIEGDVDLEAWVRDFRPVLLRRGGDVLRADRVYLDREVRNALVEALAVEGGRKQPFYVKISAHRPRSATLRVDPLTHPERSAGVREIVSLLARDLLLRTPGARVGATNLVISSRGSGGER